MESVISGTLHRAHADLALLSSTGSLGSQPEGSASALAKSLAGLALAPGTPAAPSAAASTQQQLQQQQQQQQGSGAASGNFVSEREVRRLEEAVREYAEVNDRIMAQNIALLADLEAAQRSVRDLRAGKDALAVQLKRALAAAAAPQ